MDEKKKLEIQMRLNNWETPEERKLKELKMQSNKRPKIYIPIDRKYLGMTQKERDEIHKKEKQCQK